MKNTLHSALWEQRARGAAAALLAQQKVARDRCWTWVAVYIVRREVGLHLGQF